MTQNLQQFATLFDQLAQYTEAWLDKMPADKFDWAPIENASMKFGDRVSRITVKGLIIHTCIGERHWLTHIPTVPDGGVIDLPNKALEERFNAAADWREVARAMHRENMQSIQALQPADLNKKVVFAGRTFTGLGMLWAMYAHRAFHLGNIDIYLRQSDHIAPDFFQFPSLTMA